MFVAVERGTSGREVVVLLRGRPRRPEERCSVADAGSADVASGRGVLGASVLILADFRPSGFSVPAVSEERDATDCERPEAATLGRRPRRACPASRLGVASLRNARAV